MQSSMFSSTFADNFISSWTCPEISRKSSVILGLGLVALVLLFCIHAQESRLRPPGPKPRWFIGNTIPNDRRWLKFDEWRKIYGMSPLHCMYKVICECNRHTKGTLCILPLWVNLQ